MGNTGFKESSVFFIFSSHSWSVLKGGFWGVYFFMLVQFMEIKMIICTIYGNRNKQIALFMETDYGKFAVLWK